MKKKNKLFREMLKNATSFLDEIPDEDLSSVDSIQSTMNQFLAASGLPPVSIPVPGTNFEKSPETRSFDEIEKELIDMRSPDGSA